MPKRRWTHRDWFYIDRRFRMSLEEWKVPVVRDTFDAFGVVMGAIVMKPGVHVPTTTVFQYLDILTISKAVGYRLGDVPTVVKIDINRCFNPGAHGFVKERVPNLTEGLLEFLRHRLTVSDTSV